jgi:glutamate carboxypeptidase
MKPGDAPSEELARRILDYLRPRLEEMTALVKRLVEVESPSSDPETHGPVLELFADELRRRGFRPRRVAGSTSGGLLRASPSTRSRGAGYQLLLGHLDTVWPTGTVAERPVRVDDGKLQGPGGYDMKAGLVQGLFAVDAATELAPLEVAPVFLINTDEEIGSHDSTPTIRRFARRADRVFVLEPSLGEGGRLKTARKGIGRFTITVRGKAAHAGLDPDAGASAILELSHVVQQLFALNDRERGITVNVGTIDGGLQPNVVAAQSRAVADVRVLTHADARAIEATLHALEPTTPGTSLSIEGRIGRPPMEPTEGNRQLWDMAREVASELGVPLEQATAGGGSDGNTTSLFAPTLDGLGAVGAGAHAVSEYLLVDRMVERTSLLACLLMRPALGLTKKERTP